MLAACVAGSLALELRVITVALPLAGALFAGLARPLPKSEGETSRRALVGAAAAGLALVAVTLVDHLDVLRAALADASERPGGSPWRALVDTDTNLLFDPTLSAAALLPLAAIGAVLLVRAGRARTVLAALAALAVLIPPSLFVRACRTDLIRYQSEAFFFLFVLVAGCAPRLWTGLAPRARRGAALAAAALLVVSSVPGLIDVSRPDLQEQAVALARAAPPPPTELLVPPREMHDDPRVRAELADYLVEDPERVRRLHDGETASGAGCAVWIGPACWSFTHEEAGDPPRLDGAPFRRECVALLGGPERARAALAELDEATVPRRDAEFHRVLAERPRIGFARCSE